MDMNGFDDTRETLLNHDSHETSDGGLSPWNRKMISAGRFEN